MSDILSEVKEKLNIKGIDELPKDEREKFLMYQEILSHKWEVEDIAKILRSEIKRLEDQLVPSDPAELFNTQVDTALKDLWLKARIRNYKDLLAILETPAQKKKAVEKLLKKLFNLKS